MFLGKEQDGAVSQGQDYDDGNIGTGSADEPINLHELITQQGYNISAWKENGRKEDDTKRNQRSIKKKVRQEIEQHIGAKGDPVGSDDDFQLAFDHICTNLAEIVQVFTERQDNQDREADITKPLQGGQEKDGQTFCIQAAGNGNQGRKKIDRHNQPRVGSSDIPLPWKTETEMDQHGKGTPVTECEEQETETDTVGGNEPEMRREGRCDDRGKGAQHDEEKRGWLIRWCLQKCCGSENKKEYNQHQMRPGRMQESRHRHDTRLSLADYCFPGADKGEGMGSLVLVMVMLKVCRKDVRVGKVINGNDQVTGLDWIGCGQNCGYIEACLRFIHPEPWGPISKRG